MLTHYLKIAFRNLWKYRSQTVISIVGLAVGFTCFALSAMWIRYEMTYDSFRPDAAKTYVLNHPDVFVAGGLSRQFDPATAAYLKATLPEIEDATAIEVRGENTFRLGDTPLTVEVVTADSSFLKMFGIKLIEGSREFLEPESQKIAITQGKAQELFGTENPIGKELQRDGKTLTIVAVVATQPQKTNFRLDIIAPITYRRGEISAFVCIRLNENADIDAFRKKLYDVKTSAESDYALNGTLTPLTKMHYEDVPDEGWGKKKLQFYHILTFAIAGGLVIACTLFNYLSLFVARFRIRQRELALRTVFGASVWSLFWLLAIEFLISMTAALGLAFVFIKLVFNEFQRLSDIRMNLSEISAESGVYILITSLVLLSVLAVVTFILRRRSLNLSIRNGRKNTFRRVSIVVQLVISIGFAFSAIIIICQMYYLHNTTDIGFAIKNRASLSFFYPGGGESALANRISEIPEVEKVIKGDDPLLPIHELASYRIDEWEGKTEGDKPRNIMHCGINEQTVDFWELKLVAGEWLTPESSRDDVLINEAAAKEYGWENPVGKWIQFSNRRVRGVVKDVCNRMPTVPVSPSQYTYRESGKNRVFLNDGSISIRVSFKYKEGTLDTVKEKIRNIIKTNYPEMDGFDDRFKVASDVYDDYLQVEKSLLTLLGFIALICVLICVFGFVSMISLACEERRKEIAIRKISGATVLDILNIFFRENFVLLVAGAAVAFPISYYVMRRWLEQYVRQTPVGAWIYVAILSAMAVVIVMCVGWRVWRASVENPADVVKRE
jgi:ABC-type antimicrobial peptide transport system permease subunit